MSIERHAVSAPSPAAPEAAGYALNGKKIASDSAWSVKKQRAGASGYFYGWEQTENACTAVLMQCGKHMRKDCRETSNNPAERVRCSQTLAYEAHVATLMAMPSIP